MHPDRKIGFAMGILLIGIVGALFFRNEPLMVDEVPQVRREKQLNEQLRARDVAVYLDDHTSNSDDAESTPPSGPNWTLPDIIRNLAAQKEGVPLPIGISTPPSHVSDSSPPEPQRPEEFRTLPSEDDGVTTAEPAGQSRRKSVAADGNESPNNRKLPPLFADDGTSAEASKKPATPANNESMSPDQFEEYVVRYGDTLSGIAERYLGSSTRFQEIYDANRDRLEGPDKLKVGRAIRIPQLH